MGGYDVIDRREPGFFIVDNEILEDYELSALAVAVYCHLVKWSCNASRASYQTTTSLAKRYRTRKASVVSAYRELIDSGLISLSGAMGNNVKKWDILPVKKKAQAVPWWNSSEASRSAVEQQAVPRWNSKPFRGGTQERNITNKYSKKDEKPVRQKGEGHHEWSKRVWEYRKKVEAGL